MCSRTRSAPARRPRACRRCRIRCARSAHGCCARAATPRCGAAVWKEVDHVTKEYRAFIEAAPFFALATNGPEGIDCSPRGDAPGFVRVVDEKTLMVPDRRGNNRIDSLRNIVRDPRVSLLFLIPGVGEIIRVIGRDHLSTDT